MIPQMANANFAGVTRDAYRVAISTLVYHPLPGFSRPNSLELPAKTTRVCSANAMMATIASVVISLFCWLERLQAEEDSLQLDLSTR